MSVSAAAALSDRLVVVQGDRRPGDLDDQISARGATHAAVLRDEEFLGLVPMPDPRSAAYRQTFADLAVTCAGPVVAERTSLEEAARLLVAHQSQGLPVVGADGSFRGLITPHSLLGALLVAGIPPRANGDAPAEPTGELERLAVQRAADLRRANRILEAEMSERIKAEAALRRSDLLLRSVFDNVPAYILRMSLGGTIEFINRTVPGLPREAVLGRHVNDFVPEGMRNEVAGVLGAVAATGETRVLELPAIGPHGTQAIYSCRIAPLREGHRIVGLIGVAADITETKKATAQARYYAEIVESIQIGLYVAQVESTGDPETLRCVSANPAAALLTGVPAEEVIGRTVDEVYPGLRKTGVIEMALKVQRTRTPLEIDEFWYGDARVPRSAWQFTIFPVTDDCVGVAFQNVTERKRTEEQARDLQAELAHVTRLSTMGEMASGLAHELNQPLAAIIAYADACQELVDSGRMDRGQLLEVLRAVASQAERAGKIIHRLRSLVRKSRPVRNPIQVNEAVREVAALLESEIREAGVQLQLRLGEQLPHVPADFVQIQQVLLNLLRNGLDATADADSERRELVVSTDQTAEGQVQVMIRDGGRGVTQENIARLFEPFFTTKAEGLGMGLPISRTIVEAHGGRLWLTPNADGGMLARFVLPTIAERGVYVTGTDGVHRR